MCCQHQNYFSRLLSRIAPRTRLVSQLHSEQPIDNIYGQLLSGDRQMAETPTPYHQDGSGKNKAEFEDMVRLKMLSQAKQQREKLQNQLGYLNNSIASLYKLEDATVTRGVRVSGGFRDHQASPREEWRDNIQERAKELERKKKIAQEIKNKREEEIKEMEERIREEQQEKKKREIAQNVRNIEERAKRRAQELRESNQRHSQLLKQKQNSLHLRLSQTFNTKQKSFLEQRKKKLAQIRNLHRPLDQLQLKQHQQKFLQNKRQKQQLRQRQRKMNQSRSRSYQPFYKSVFYQRAVEEDRREDNAEHAKMEKIKQYAEKVKEMFLPEVDERKKQQLEELIDREKRKEEEKLEKERELRELSKEKGIQYLQLVKSLPKKPKTSTPPPAPQPQLRQYPNYLSQSLSGSSPNPIKQFSRILASDSNKQDKALLLQYQTERYEEELKRKEQQVRLLKKGDEGEVDYGYYEIIKAKLELLTATQSI